MSLTKVKGKVLPLQNQLSSTDNSIEVDDYHVTNTPYVSIRKFLTVKDGSIDASSILQNALNNYKNITIPGDYTIRLDSAGINIPLDCSLMGEDGRYPTILINHTTVTTSQFILGGRNIIKNLRVRYPLQKTTLDTNETPINYGPLFSGSGFYSVISDLDIGNCYYGFKLGGNTEGSASKITMFNIIGSPIYRGLSLDRVLDIPRISDIHFNQNYLTAPYIPSLSLRQWTHENGEAFHVGRVDFAAFFRLFAFGYKHGIYFRGERYTGSSDTVRLIDCDFDICLHPIWAQNFAGTLSIRGGKFTGNAVSTTGLVEPADGSYNQIYATVPASNVYIMGARFGNYSKDAFRVGSSVSFDNCVIYDYGSDNGQRAGITTLTDTSPDVILSSTVITGDKGTQTRGVYSVNGTGTLSLTNNSQILGATLEGFRWVSGKVLYDNTSYFNTASRTNMSFLTNQCYDYQSDSVPTSGSYYQRGDYVRKINPTNGNITTQVNYFVVGWIRLTASNVDGTNHVLGTDWQELRAITGAAAINAYNGTTLQRPTTAGVGTQYFDTTLGKPIWLKTAPSTWVDSTGTVV